MKLSSLVFLLAVGAGCAKTFTLNYIDFPVEENGRSVVVKKWFMDGTISDQDGRPRAFHAAQNKDLPGALKIMEEEVARDPKDMWNHYDLAILQEASGAWDKAELEIKEAQRLNPPSDTANERRFREEAEFIARHKK